MRFSQFQFIFITSLFLVTFYNLSFFKAVLNDYAFSLENIAFLISLTIALFCFIVLFLTLLSTNYTFKALIIVLLITSSLSSYFMDSYHIVIDDDMINNIIQTNITESLDLLNIKLFAYLIFLGILPALFVLKVSVEKQTFKELVFHKLKVLFIVSLIATAMFFTFSKSYLSFVREHKPIRYYINPLYYVFSLGKYIGYLSKTQNIVVKNLGTDAHTPLGDDDRELIILVIGETARADRFSINGYQRKTNPLLEKESIISLQDMHSCGTSTAVSVPCIFSILNKDQYSDSDAQSTENILDVLQYAGANILWRDNNSDSKGVALRVEYQNYKDAQNNPVCDIECRDEGMLHGLQDYINVHEKGDILIVLHQMGSHGPAYYKRYPNDFEKFKPVCKTNQLEQCSTEEINNAYDNTILYTDYFLANVIDLLKKNSKEFETAMLYVSDHGESLGENGLYLHGLPYFMAPEEQKHVAAMLWFGKRFKIDVAEFKKEAFKSFSHDNIFHTLLGLMEIKTAIYNKQMDIVGNYKHEYSVDLSSSKNNNGFSMRRN